MGKRKQETVHQIENNGYPANQTLGAGLLTVAGSPLFREFQGEQPKRAASPMTYTQREALDRVQIHRLAMGNLADERRRRVVDVEKSPALVQRALNLVSNRPH